jgi:hypothetical protein
MFCQLVKRYVRKKSPFPTVWHNPLAKSRCNLKQLQQFGKPTWHPSKFGKTRKIGLQQFAKPTWQK